MDKLPDKAKRKPPIISIILFILFCISLFLRTYLPYDSIFTGEHISFRGVDPWYHMRLVENLLHHFPHIISFDPYTFYPYGQNVAFAPFYDFIIALSAWIIGLGHPSKQVIETVGAYFPAILGALAIFPVYVLGKDLFNRNVGLISAALISILPGEFLARSLLGFTDHHVAEVLLSTITVLFFVKALKSAGRDLSFRQLFTKDGRDFKNTLIYSLLAGIALASYILSWTAALLLIFVLFFYMVIQYIICHLRNEPSDYLCLITTFSFLLALIIIIPFSHRGFLGELHIPVLVICILTSLVLSGISKLMIRKKINRFLYPFTVAGLALVCLGIFLFLDPDLLKSMFDKFSVFLPTKTSLTVGEARPVLYPYGVFSLPHAMWNYFTTAFLFALASLFWLIYDVGKRGRPEKTLLLVWSLLMLIAMLGQRRFAYYFAINVALLGGLVCGKMIEWSSLRKPGSRPTVVIGLSKDKIRQFVAVAVIFLAAFCPNMRQAIAVARQSAGLVSISQDWYHSLQWMRTNTPDPFHDPDFYYALYKKPESGKVYEYPESAYGVMSWWDYGHWITYVAHRIPNTNPHQRGAKEAAKFLTAPDESMANNILNKLASKYVIIDRKMTLKTLYTMAVWAGERVDGFFEIYYRTTPDGRGKPVKLYYPAYYRSMASRLYNFGGKEVTPNNSTWVVSYSEKTDKKGKKHKVISTLKLFSTYEEAKAYMESQGSPHHRIVGINPFLSPVPLDGLRSYKLVHESPPRAMRGKKVSYVKIFEYTCY